MHTNNCCLYLYILIKFIIYFIFLKSYFIAKIKDVIYDFYMNINNDKLHF